MPRDVRLPEPMQGEMSDDKLPDGPAGPTDGWSEMEKRIASPWSIARRDFKGDARRVYLTGLSYGGFGAWNLAARHPQKFAALAPIVGYGHPDHAAPIASAKLPLWVFAGGRDPVVPLRYFYPVLNKLEALGHPEVRFTNRRRPGPLDLGARVRRRGHLRLVPEALTRLTIPAKRQPKCAAVFFPRAARPTTASGKLAGYPVTTG